MAKKITRAKIKFISLCKRGVNNVKPIYKSQNDNSQSIPIYKSELGEGRLTSLVYVPNTLDSEGEFADDAEVMNMMKSFAQQGLGIDFEHNGKLLDKSDVYVLESFRVGKNHPLAKSFKDYNGNVVDAKGGWAVTIQMEDTELGNTLKKAYQSGELEGISMGGSATITPALASEEKSLLKMLSRVLGKSHNTAEKTGKEIEMTPEELAKALADNNEKLSETLTKAIIALREPKAPADTGSVQKSEPLDIPFEGDASSLEDVRAHHEILKKAKLEQSVDWGDVDSVQKYYNTLEAMEKSHQRLQKSKQKKAVGYDPRDSFNDGTMDGDQPLSKAQADEVKDFISARVRA